MWQSIVAVALLPALGVAQNQAPSASLQGDLRRPSFQVLTEKQSLHRDATERVVLLISLGKDPIVSPRESSRALVPLKIEFEPSEGISVSSISFPLDERLPFTLQMRREPETPHASLNPPADIPRVDHTGKLPPPEMTRLAAQGTRIAVFSPTFPVRCKVKISKDAPVGPHQLHGKVWYQPIRSDGVFPPQQMEIVVPITVVGRGVAVRNNVDYARINGSNSRENRDLIWLILLAPILIPLSILAAIVGMDC